MKVHFSSLHVLFLFLLGCVTPEQLASADYGTVPVSSTYWSSTKHLIRPMLVELATARFRFDGEPQKGYAYLSGRSSPPVFGYLVHVGINAKNMMGNYVGEVPYRFFLKHDTIYLLNKSDKAEVVP